MNLWRLSKTRYALSALSGEGNFVHGARWNPPGTRAIYFSETLSLACLETFVHLPTAARHLEFVALEGETPISIQVSTIKLEDLPSDWRTEPAPKSTQEVGARWFREGTTAFLRVPSVIAPREHNVVGNPAHPDFRRLRLEQPTPFSFDPRMWKA